MNRSNKIGWAQVRAGIFIFTALVFLAVGIVMMGQKTKMFVTKSSLTVIMDDVLGLKVGAQGVPPVRRAGLVGRGRNSGHLPVNRRCSRHIGR